MRLKFNDTSLDYARTFVAAAPYPGKSKAGSAVIVDEYLDGIGEEYPACSVE